jgi:hypothetical protein
MILIGYRKGFGNQAAGRENPEKIPGRRIKPLDREVYAASPEEGQESTCRF